MSFLLFLLVKPPDEAAQQLPPRVMELALGAPWDAESSPPCTGVIRRSQARQRIAREVIEGALSLLEAAQCFRDLDLASPDYNWNAFREFLPDCASDDERHARHVIAIVSSTLNDEPHRCQAVVARLETALGNNLRQRSLCLMR